MNRQHLYAFFWLRWRLFVNQLRRGGIANTVILALVLVGAGLASLSLFVLFLGVGLFAVDDVPAKVLMYVWDGLVILFLMLWMIGLLTDLQRSEALSLQNFLHLPVSLSGVFALNYLSSYFGLALIVAVPAMIGFCLGLIFSRGPVMVLQLPLIAAFVLMVTALSYQFQGWLASLMVNKRRRRTIVVLVTFVAILMCQLPNLVNVLRPWEGKEAMTPEEGRQTLALLEQTAYWGNMIAPPGWLPYGAMALAEGNLLPFVLGFVGMTLIGSASLYRAYRTTVRLYTGAFTAGQKQSVPAATLPKSVKSSATWLDKNLPWLPEQAAAIALANLRSLTRAPEAKMLLLSPIFLFLIFGGLFWRSSGEIPDNVRPLCAFAAISMTLFTLGQLLANQFGFDRAGYRVFVLSPAPRKEMLLGKNLAVAPLALTLSLIPCIFVEVVAPMRFDRFLAVLPQFVSMFLLFCLAANGLSILAPMAIAAGTLKPTNTKALPILLNMLFMLLMPIFLAPALVPLGIEVALEESGWVKGLPISLVLSIALAAGVVWVYRSALTWQGDLLQAREQRILEVVTTKTE